MRLGASHRSASRQPAQTDAGVLVQREAVAGSDLPGHGAIVMEEIRPGGSSRNLLQGEEPLLRAGLPAVGGVAGGGGIGEAALNLFHAGAGFHLPDAQGRSPW